MNVKIDPLMRANLPDPQGYFEKASEPMRAGTKTMKNCYVASDFRPQVKIFFGGNQHVLCSTTWRFVVTAIRLADAAILYFWKYRRIKRQPADCDFNFSYDTAKSDLEHPFVEEFMRNAEIRIASQFDLPEIRNRIGVRDLQPSRIRMMQVWSEFRELFKQVYFQCPDTPKTKINLKYGKETIESLDNMLRTINSTVRDVESEVSTVITTAVLGESTTAVLGESTTAVLGESTTAAPPTNLFQK